MRARRPARRRSSRRRASPGRGAIARRARSRSTRSAARWPAAHVAIGIERPHPLGEHDAPLEGLHAAHRSADDRQPAPDAEVVGERGLGAHHVADRDDREARAVRPAGRRVDRRPVRSSPGSRRARWRTRRSSGRCRWPRPGPMSPSHQPGAGWPGPLGPAAWRSPVRAWHTSTALAAVGVERAPRLVGDRRRRAARRRPRGRTDGRPARCTNCRRPDGSPGRHAPLGGSGRRCSAALGWSGWSIVVSVRRGVGLRVRAPHGARHGGRARTLRCRRRQPRRPHPRRARGRDGTLGVRPRLPDLARGRRATRDVVGQHDSRAGRSRQARQVLRPGSASSSAWCAIGPPGR